MNRLVIVGAGGHGKVICDIALKNGYSDVSFIDDSTTGGCMGFPIIGKSDKIQTLNDGKTDFIIAIGNNKVRKNIAERYDVNWTTLIHPSAQIATNAHIGRGSVVMAGAVINADAVIGNHCIINTRAVAEHDNIIKDYVHISPGVSLGGTACVGEQTHVGIGATVINNITICDNCVIGAGAVVIKNISHSGTYVGVPAKELV